MDSKWGTIVFNRLRHISRLALVPCLAFAPTVQALTLYVATDVNDNWSGKLARPTVQRNDGPVASLTGARDKIRLFKNGKPLTDAVTVVVENGTYTIKTPITLTGADSGTSAFPIRYQADAGAQPVISGGQVISGWSQGTDGTWWVDIPAVKQGSWYFEQLWINGHRARRARASNDTVTYSYGVQERQIGTNLYQQTITVNPQDIQLLSGLTSRELKDVSFVALHKWNTTRRFIYSANVQAGTISVRSSAPMSTYNPMTAWMPYYIENFRPALDQPGEWFLSRAGRLYYMPRADEDMRTAKVVAPVSNQLLTLSGNPYTGSYVEYVSFDGLSFQHSQWLTPAGGVDPSASSSASASILVQGARNVDFSNCEVAHTGTYAMWLWYGTRDSTLRHCKLEDLGAGGLRIGDGVSTETSTSFTTRVTIDNNIIRHGGRVFHNAYGIWIGDSSDNVVTHNEIADFFEHGISVGWTWGYASNPTVRNQISYNHIHHLGWRLLSDMGGIHTLGISTGTVLRNNVINDIYPYSYGGWGLYLDEGSSQIVARDNLVFNAMSASFELNYGRSNVVSNNIFADGLTVQLQKTRQESQNSLNFTNNIVYWKAGDLFKGYWDTPDVTFAANLYFNASGPVWFGWMDFATWQSGGRDAGSMVADPLFVDPDHADFRLNANSPAFAIGFQPFDSSLAGVYGDVSWLGLAAQEPYAAVEMPPALPSFSHLP